MNYYELFGLPQTPVVDRKHLAEKFFALQKKFHPDFFSNESEEAQAMALQQSADVNKAFQVFSDPMKTIEYFLRLKAAFPEDEKYALPPAFLAEMMELNEAISEEGKQRVSEQVQELESLMEKEIEPILNGALDDQASIEKLKAYYFKKKYLRRILDRFDD
jgi:molecular chaperone HscB